MPEVATPNQGEREFETGTDEFFKAHSELNALNGKRTYDEFQDVSLTSARRSQAHFDDLNARTCLLYTSPSPRDYAASRMPSSA